MGNSRLVGENVMKPQNRSTLNFRNKDKCWLFAKIV